MGVVQVHTKSLETVITRKTAAFLDRVRTEKVRLRYDTEPAMVMLAEKVAAFRHPEVTLEEPRAPERLSGRERTHRTLHAGVRALRFQTFLRACGLT